MLTPSNNDRLQPMESAESETMPVDLEPVHRHLLTVRSALRNSAAVDRLAAYTQSLPPQPDVLERTAIAHNFATRGGAAPVGGDNSQGQNPMHLHNKPEMRATDADAERKVHEIYTSRRQPRPLKWLHTSMAVAAAVLVVGLLAATLVVFSHRPPPSAHIAATPGQSPTLTPRPAQSWSQVANLSITTNIANAMPAIAPSDPSIVYEVASSPQLALRRTHDGGATWQSFPLPVQNATNEMQLYVSPLNPNVVVLHTDGWVSQPSTCISRADAWTPPASGSRTTSPLADLVPAGPKSGTVPCTQFLSTNGGRSWTQTPDFFDAAPIIFEGPSVSGIFMVQGNRLYTYDDFTCQSLPQSYVCSGGLLFSQDGGVTWQPASIPSPSTFCGLAMAPTGTVMFAITSSACVGGSGSSDNTIWRSDDAGVHWLPVSHLQFTTVESMVVIPSSGAAYPTVYLATITSTFDPTVSPPVKSTFELQVSVDGGATWTSAPTGGLPTGWLAGDVIAQTSDGSAIAWAGPRTGPVVDLYTWKPGSSGWQVLTSGAPVSIATYLVTPSQAGQGGDTLWAVTVVPTYQGNSAVFVNRVYRLQV